GLVTINPSGGYEPGPEFYEAGHVARAARPQAVHVGLGVSSPDSSVKAVAFHNPDGSVGIFGHSRSSSEQVVAVTGAGTTARFTVPPGALFTFLSPPVQSGKPVTTIKPFTVIRVPATGASWYVDGSLRTHWIQDGETFLCLAARRVPLQDGLTQAMVDALGDPGPHQPKCLAPTRFELKILQAPDNFSYLVQGGVRHWIPDGGTFLCLKVWNSRAVTAPMTWDQVSSIPEDTKAHATCSADGTANRVIRESRHGTSWYVDPSLRKHWIPDGETYFCMTARYALIDGLTQEHADALADGDWVAPCLEARRFEGKIVRALDQPDPKPSYAVYAGRRHWIPDPWTYGYLTTHGFPVVDVPTEAGILTISDGGTEPAKLDPAAVPRNSIIRRNDGVSWVIDHEGNRHHIPYVQDDVCWRDLRGYPVSAVNLTFAQANALPEKDRWPCIIGDRMVRSDDGSSWYVDTTNLRHWIPDTDTYYQLIRDLNLAAVGPWPAQDVNLIPRGADRPQLIDKDAVRNSIVCRERDRHCWAIDGNATRHFIPSYGDDVCWRWVNGWRVTRPNMNDVQTDSLGEAEPWGCSMHNRLIATNEGPAYYMEGNTRRPIVDGYDYNCLAENGSPQIRGMSNAEAAGLALGPTMPMCSSPSYRIVSIRSNANGRTVSAEFGYGGNDYAMLRARNNGVGGAWETFRLIGDCNSGCGIQSAHTRQFVAAEAGYQGYAWGEMRARSGGIGGWETFRLIGDCNSGCAIWANANGRYVSAELDFTGNGYAMLRARSETIGGWERFTIR
ncbi:MAG: glycoside hydrolase family 30 beta sandwich domain-containing protein, partial [Acidimicrobiales bacterium]